MKGTDLRVWMVLLRGMVVVPHESGQLVYVVDKSAAQHISTSHITICHYHIASYICYIHSS